MSTGNSNNYKTWLKKGVPAVLIPGIIFASMYGVGKINKMNNYYLDENVFPKTGMVETFEDGDTFKLQTGQSVRLLGVDAPNRGKAGETEARDKLKELVENDRLWLEYDRYQDDKYGRILAWVWVGCETNEVKFKPADYMHLNGNESRDFIVDKPGGCKKGQLVNREMVNKGMAVPMVYSKRGRLKYNLF